MEIFLRALTSVSVAAKAVATITVAVSGGSICEGVDVQDVAQQVLVKTLVVMNLKKD